MFINDVRGSLSIAELSLACPPETACTFLTNVDAALPAAAKIACLTECVVGLIKLTGLVKPVMLIEQGVRAGMSKPEMVTLKVSPMPDFNTVKALSPQIDVVLTDDPDHHGRNNSTKSETTRILL